MTKEEAIETIKKVLPMSKTLEDAFYTLHPELCESGDERIRKEIVDFIQWAEDRGMTRHDYHQAKRPAVWIAYLEKQKEQKPISQEDFDTAKDDTNPYDMQASEALEYAIKRGFGVPFNDGEVYVDVRHMTQTIGNIIRWADEHPKEQKPVAWGEDDDILFNNVLNGLKYAYEDLTNHKSYDSAKDVKEAYDWMVSRFKYFCPNLQPKQEWSEEEKEIIRQNGRLDVCYNPEKYGLCHKTEWSEEDEKKIAQLKTFLAQEWFNKEKRNKALDMIDALRPQPHTVSIKDATKFGNLEYERCVKAKKTSMETKRGADVLLEESI